MYNESSYDSETGRYELLKTINGVDVRISETNPHNIAKIASLIIYSQYSEEYISIERIRGSSGYTLLIPEKDNLAMITASSLENLKHLL